MTYRRTARRTRWIAGLLIVVLTGLGGAAGWFVEHSRGPQYQASTDVLVQFWSVQGFLLTGQGSPVSSQDVADAATLATSPDVLELAASRLGNGITGTALASTVTATPQLVSHGITIVATGTAPGQARDASEAVAQAMTDTLNQRIENTAAGLSAVSNGDFRAVLEQRAQVLTSSVQPLEVLQTGTPQQTAPTIKTPVMLAVVGLAAGVLLVIALVFARPVVSRAREAQRLTELPAVPFELPQGGAQVSRLLRRLLESRPDGDLLVLPVDADAEKAARQFAEWSRERALTAADAARVVAGPEPVSAVLDARPDDVAALLLVVPEGTPRRTLADAVALLGTWRPADVVVVPA